MKKFLSVMLFALLAAGTVQADGPKHRGKKDEPRKENRPRPVMTLPVYADSTRQQNKFTAEITPEERAKFGASRKRRMEIMVLIGAYKIMPANERAALKAELLKRIEADFQATMADQRERIARAEADLQKLRKELSEREANGKVLVERELDRLLKIEFPRSRPGAPKKP